MFFNIRKLLKFYLLCILKTRIGHAFFQMTGDAISSLLSFTNKGATFLFGDKLLDGSFSFIFGK